jgi:hypothetical protein
VRQQTGLVQLPAVVEQLRGVGDGHDRFRDRFVGRDDRAHARLERTQILLRERSAPAHRAEVSADRRRRVLDHHVGFGEHFRRRRHQEERQRPPVNPCAIGIRDEHRRHVRIADQRRAELAQTPIDDRGDGGSAPGVTIREGHVQDVAKGRAHGRFINPPIAQPRMNGLARRREPDRC